MGVVTDCSSGTPLPCRFDGAPSFKSANWLSHFFTTMVPLLTFSGSSSAFWLLYIVLSLARKDSEYDGQDCTPTQCSRWTGAPIAMILKWQLALTTDQWIHLLSLNQCYVAAAACQRTWKRRRKEAVSDLQPHTSRSQGFSLSHLVWPLPPSVSGMLEAAEGYSPPPSHWGSQRHATSPTARKR